MDPSIDSDDPALEVHYTDDEVETLVEEILAEQIHPLHLFQFICWVNRSKENYEKAKALIRELHLYQVSIFRPSRSWWHRAIVANYVHH